ncbi:MAG: hypothetical protein KTR30_18200 [Saprospiraceae bacterium]|nr:hypothetical protein [Saprospiraceae bacterium]
MRTTLLFYLFLFLSGGISLWGQGSGSIYSAYGLGDLNPRANGQVQGLGGAGIGLSSPYFLNLTNPASYSSLSSQLNMFFDFGLQANYLSMTSEEAVNSHRSGGLSHINLWLRFTKDWSNTIGLQPYSSIGYSIQSGRYSDILGEPYQLIYQGEGGVTRLFWGHSYALSPFLSIGANANFLFGSIDKSQTFSSNSVISNFVLSEETFLRAFTYDLGLQLHLPLRRDLLTLGATFSPAVDLPHNTDITLDGFSGGLFAEDTDERQYGVPMEIGAGLSWKASTFLVTADLLYQDWEGLDSNEDIQYVNTWTTGGGLEFIPFKNELLDYEHSLLVRTGFQLKNSNWRINGNNFTEWSYTLGLGIPFNRYTHHMNINYTYHQRGTLENDLIQEVKHEISVSFTLRDIWFMKRKIF